MIVGIGIDVVPVARLARELRDPDGSFRDAVFTAAETGYCESKRYPARHFAARFAAKEALLKALGGAGDAMPPWREVELRTEDDGIPRLLLYGRLREIGARLGVEAIHVSLTHSPAIAAAIVVMESRGRTEVC